MIGSYLSPPSPCDYQSFGSIAFGPQNLGGASGDASESQLMGTVTEAEV